jgi:hypothetical protein
VSSHRAKLGDPSGSGEFTRCKVGHLSQALGITHGSPRHKGCVRAQARVEAVADGSTGDIFQVNETLPSSRLQVNEPAYRLPRKRRRSGDPSPRPRRC